MLGDDARDVLAQRVSELPTAHRSSARDPTSSSCNASSATGCAEALDVEWDDEAVAHMLASHGVTVSEAEEALADIERVAQIPDPASRTGSSDRYINWSTSCVMNDKIPARVKAALDAEIAADTDDEAGQAYREGLPDAASGSSPLAQVGVLRTCYLLRCRTSRSTTPAHR